MEWRYGTRVDEAKGSPSQDGVKDLALPTAMQKVAQPGDRVWRLGQDISTALREAERDIVLMSQRDPKIEGSAEALRVCHHPPLSLQ